MNSNPRERSAVFNEGGRGRSAQSMREIECWRQYELSSASNVIKRDWAFLCADCHLSLRLVANNFDNERFGGCSITLIRVGCEGGCYGTGIFAILSLSGVLDRKSIASHRS